MTQLAVHELTPVIHVMGHYPNRSCFPIITWTSSFVSTTCLRNIVIHLTTNFHYPVASHNVFLTELEILGIQLQNLIFFNFEYIGSLAWFTILYELHCLHLYLWEGGEGKALPYWNLFLKM